MKKILLAASLAALLPLLFSCGKTEGSENNFVEPRFIQYAGQLIMNNVNAAPAARTMSVAPLDAPASYVESVEFTESGIYVVGINNAGSVTYKTGSYTVSGNVYSLSGFGTVEFVSVSGTSAQVVVKYDGKSEQATATYRQATRPDPIYRGWTIDKTRATVYGFHTPASADFVGCNFQEIAKFLKDNGHDPGDVPAGSLTSVSITASGSIIFSYTDGTADVGDCTVSGSSVNFTWRNTARVFVIENGKATIEYMDGKCILKVDATLKGSTTSGSVTFVMSPMA